MLTARRRMAALFDDHEMELSVMALIVTNSLTFSTMQRRSVWARQRSRAFMEITSGWDEREWKRNLRVSRPTFFYLCSKLHAKLQRTHKARAPISVETKVAITLWRLGTNVEYRTISHLFGVGISTACGIVYEVCQEIVRYFLRMYIKIPQGHDAMAVVEGFQNTWDFPQCFGAVDGSHIPIITPADNATDYFNQKKFPSIVLQAMVDHEYRFMNVYAGWPGSVHDARILANSDLFAMGEAGTLVPNSVQTMSGVPVPVVILGNPAYPLLPWLMKPYPGVGLSAKHRKFNNRLSRARVVTECAFGRLKGRWRCLLKRNDIKVDFMPTLVTACCVLHNICEIHQDSFDHQWLDDEVTQASNMSRSASTIPSSSTAISIRNALCDYIDRN